MQRESGFAANLFGLLLGALAGCSEGPRTQAPPPAPHRGVTLRVACPIPVSAPAGKEAPAPAADDPAAAVRAYGQAWASRQGAALDIRLYDPHQGPPAEADVWVLTPAELPRYASAGQLLPVPAAFLARDASYAWSDLLPLYREHLLTWQHTPWGLPLMGEAPVCCYRADMLEDPAHREAFRRATGRDLAPPATWAEFAEIAEFFRTRLPGRHSLPPLPASDRALDRAFCTVAACYARKAAAAGAPVRLEEDFSFYYDLNDGTPRIATPGFLHALTLLRRLQACRPKGTAAEPERAFQQGQAVLCVTDAPWLATFQKTPGLRDKVGVTRVPGGECTFAFARGARQPAAEPNRVPYLGGAGWLAVVPRTAAHPESAFDLLTDLSGPQTSGQMVLAPRWGAGPVRDEQLRRERWDSFDLDTAETLRLKEVLH